MSTTNENTPSTVPNSMGVLIKFAAATIFALLLTWGVLGRMVVEKLATALAAPCGIIWYIMIVCIVLAYTSGRRAVLLMSVFAWLAYTVVGSGLLAGRLARNIEAPFVQIIPEQQRPFDTVVLLGGGASVGANQRFQGNTSGDRVILVAQLYHAGVAPKIICTGKRIVSVDGEGQDAAQISANVLTGLGVPESAIQMIGGRNTSEEMQNLSEHFGTDTGRIGLVTSAWHLPRALRLALSRKLEFEPLPADFISGPAGAMTTAQWIMAVVPQAENFVTVTKIAKEYLAAAVGR